MPWSPAAPSALDLGGLWPLGTRTLPPEGTSTEPLSGRGGVACLLQAQSPQPPASGPLPSGPRRERWAGRGAHGTGQAGPCLTPKLILRAWALWAPQKIAPSPNGVLCTPISAGPSAVTSHHRSALNHSWTVSGPEAWGPPGMPAEPWWPGPTGRRPAPGAGGDCEEQLTQGSCPLPGLPLDWEAPGPAPAPILFPPGAG